MGNLYFAIASVNLILAFASVFFILSRTPSNEQRLLQILSIFVLVYDIGQVIAASSLSEAESITGFRFSHYGGVHISLCFLTFYCLIVRVRISKIFVGIISIINLCWAYGFTFSSPNWFIKSIHFIPYEFGSERIIEYTPFHNVFLLWNAFIYLLVIVVTIHCIIKKKYVFFYSREVIIGYFISGLITMISFNVTALTQAKFDYTSCGITVSIIMLIIVTYKFNAFPTSQDTRDDVLDSMEDPIISMDKNNRLLYANKKAKELFSDIPEFVYDMPLRGLDENLDRALNLTEGQEFELFGRFYRLYVKEIFNKRHALIGTTGILIDITKEKAFADEQIKLRNEANTANLAKAQFLAHMSHEIRTPINAILGMDELIIRENQDPTTLEYAGNIMRAGQSLLSIINDILDFSKIEAGKMEIVESDYRLTSVIKDILILVNMRAQKKGLQVNVNIDENTPDSLCGDEVRVKQIITNIMTNAVKYTEKGSVSLSIGFDKKSDSQADIKIEVKDTGIGIKEEDIPKLYGSFERIENSVNHKVEGTGLGMSITLQLLKLMGGTLDVSSVYGNGSTFVITIPQKISGDDVVGVYKEEVSTKIEARESRKSYTAPDAVILVVDDNSVNRVVARSLLKKTKIKVEEASSGEECLIKIREKRYDLIFMDHLMPGMSGVEVFQEIKKRKDHLCEDVPIIALTADATVGVRKMFKDIGFDDFISKPIDPVEYEEKLAKYLPEEKVLYN